MDHKETCLLYAYGELGRAEAAEFERHLDGCAACRERLAAARLTHELAPATLETPTARLVEGALAGACDRSRVRVPRPARRFQPWGLLVVAGLACVSGIGIFVYVSRTPPVPPVKERPAPAVLAPAPALEPAERSGAPKARAPRKKLEAKDLSESFRLEQPDDKASSIRFAEVAAAQPAMPSIVLRQPAPAGSFSLLGR